MGNQMMMGGGNDAGAQNNRPSAKHSTGHVLSLAKKMVPPPVMGVLLGMVVATVPILRSAFVGTASGDSRAPSRAPLGVVFDTAQNFGKAASPLSLLVLVSSLAMGAGFGKKAPPAPAREQGGSHQPAAPAKCTLPFYKRWAIVSFSRCVVSPALMLGLLKAASSDLLRNSIGSPLEQPMLWFVCLLESCMPPAQNQVVMLQVANKMEQANEMATFLFGVYATSMVPLTVIVSLALDRLGLM